MRKIFILILRERQINEVTVRKKDRKDGENERRRDGKKERRRDRELVRKKDS